MISCHDAATAARTQLQRDSGMTRLGGRCNHAGLNIQHAVGVRRPGAAHEPAVGATNARRGRRRDLEQRSTTGPPTGDACRS